MTKMRGLFWQLRFSHLLVTVLTALVLGVCVLLGYFWYANTGQIAAWAAEDALSDAEYVVVKQAGSNPLTSEQSQKYINKLTWPYLEPERRDGLHGETPDWYASSWMVILTPEGKVLATNQIRGMVNQKPFASYRPPGFQQSWLHVKKPLLYKNRKSLSHWVLVEDLHIGFAPIITEDNNFLGWVYERSEQQTSLQFLREIANTLFYGLVGAATIAVLTSALVGSHFAKNISLRLAGLSQLSQAYAKGDFTQRHHGQSLDEVGQLGEQFNRMAEQISSQMLELRQLASTNTQLLEKSRALASLEERNRIARDLHDAVKQQLFGLNLNISAIKRLLYTNPEQAAVQLEHVNHLTSQALEEMDVILKQLRPVLLERKGLVLALEEMLKNWTTQTNVKSFIQAESQARLPAEFEQCLYRIAQEGLHNIAKHAQAQHVQLKIMQHPDHVCFSLEDDGIGFNTSQTVPHALGLKSMSERAVALGGKFDIISNSGGTQLRVHLPLGVS